VFFRLVFFLGVLLGLRVFRGGVGRRRDPGRRRLRGGARRRGEVLVRVGLRRFLHFFAARLFFPRDVGERLPAQSRRAPREEEHRKTGCQPASLKSHFPVSQVIGR